MRGEDPEFPTLQQELDLSNLQLQETLFVVISVVYV